MRLVSLTCSNTEIVAALGVGDQLVGVDDHSDYPPSVVSAAARVGKDLDIDLDRVAALRPDLVLASLTVPGHERVVAGLRDRGIPHVAPEPTSLPDVYRDIADIGALLGRERAAEAVIAAMREGLGDGSAPGERPPPPRADAPVILVEWWPKPVFAPGRRSWVDDLLALAGARGPLSAWDVKSAPYDAADPSLPRPDAVVMAWCGVPERKYRAEIVARRPGWEGVPAVQSGRIVPISEAWLGRPGPRLVEGGRALRQLADALRAG